MSGIVFGRTQQAIQTPFEPLRNPGYGGVPSVLTSTEVQTAIEEAINVASGNNRFVILGAYNANALTGRYIEFFNGIDSSVAPIYFPVTSKLLTVISATTAATATCTLGFFNLAVSSVTPVYTVTFTAQQRVTNLGSLAVPLATFPVGALVAVRVTSGSINKPYLHFFMSAAL